MVNRNNKVTEEAVKEGIRISRSKGEAYAFLGLRKSKVPNAVILRVIFQPHKIRSTEFE